MRPEGQSTRRTVIRNMAALAGGLAFEPRPFNPTIAPSFRLATFSADVTIPIGHPCMGGGISPAKVVLDPLEARGIVLIPNDGRPIVIVAVDWCEIRNDAYDRWRVALAEAAGTDPSRVLVSCVHQHDAPVVDLTAERLLREHRATGSVCDPEFHETAVRRVASALEKGLKSSVPITHFGTGMAKVDRVAANRRYLGADGKPTFGRTSASRDAYAREQPEGTIDPYLRTLSFWDGDRPVAAMSVYATHPMSYYGRGEVSADFIGLARRRRQAEELSIFQIYMSGCSGNVTAGKYNNGAPENRPVLADRIYRGMVDAWEATRRQPITTVTLQTIPLRLSPRDDAGFTVADLTRRLTTDPKPFGQCLAAMGLSWRKRADARHAIDLPVLDLGAAQWLLLPGESYVEFQLHAQRVRPDSFVVTIGYGECATGYLPIERAIKEHDSNLNDWCWVAPGSERTLIGAIDAALSKSARK
ncbi:MAG: hypothetical protein JWN86_66 [Planctomycetota bacterium]|nr:hypothetical protein [Planctomycetota bacterium]